MSFAFLLSMLSACQQEMVMKCNGLTELCKRRINEITIAGTHNSMASKEANFIPPNHNLGIEKQLDSGIRGLNIDLYWYEDDVYMCHFDCQLGKTPFEEGLNVIHQFLEENPNEVIIITLQSGLDASDVLAVFESVNLSERLHQQELGMEWPTLEALIDSKQNILLFSDRNGIEDSIYHAQWTHWLDNPYQAESEIDFKCEPNRGNRETATLYNINHFISAPIALEVNAIEANQYDVLFDHVSTCINETGLFPNQILVDFWSVGEILSLVDELNKGLLVDMSFMSDF